MVKQAQNERQSAHRTHWAAQFAVASELCKRGYQVALTMGTHPVIDLMVVSPKGIPFLINVKGQYKKHSWPVRLKKARGKLFYVLAFVPEVGQNPAVEKGREGSLKWRSQRRNGAGFRDSLRFRAMLC